MHRCSIVLAICVLAPSPGSAQSSVSAYWESLSVAPTLTQAASLQRPPVDSATGADELVEGMMRLREYEITLDRSSALIALRELERAIEKSPDDAWAHFALGAALARGPDVRERAFAERRAYTVRRFSNAALRAPRVLRRALELEPRLHAAAIELGQLAFDMRDRELMREAVKILTSPGHADHAPALLLAARLQKTLNLPVEAAELAGEAKANGYDATLADLERASALLRIRGGEEAGVRAYFEGLDAPSAAGIAAYTADIAMLLDPAQLGEWRGLAPAGRKKWLQTFWEESAALAGVSVSRRLAAHYARLDAVQGQGRGPVFEAVDDTLPVPTHPLARMFGKRSIGEMQPGNLTMIRHGDPTRVKRFMFCAPGWDTLPVAMQPTLSDCLRSPYGRGISSSRLLQAQAEAKGLPGQSYYPSYEQHLSIAWEAFQFRAPEGGAQVVAAIAVRGQSAAALRDNQNNFQPLIMLTLADTAAGWIRQALSRDRYDGSRYTPDAWLLFGAATVAPAGSDVELRITIENDAETAGSIAYGTIDVASFTPDSLTMSDVVISPEDAYGRLQRGDVRVALAPGRSFRPDETPTLYYEVYGTRPGGDVVTEIRITPVRESLLERMRAALGRDDGTVSIRFTEPNAGAEGPFGLQQSRTIGLSDLLPGEYRVTVIVTDQATGRSVRREKWLQLD